MTALYIRIYPTSKEILNLLEGLTITWVLVPKETAKQKSLIYTQQHHAHPQPKQAATETIQPRPIKDAAVHNHQWKRIEERFFKQ